MKWVGGGEEEEKGGDALKCLGQIILGRQSIFPGIWTTAGGQMHTHTLREHPS